MFEHFPAILGVWGVGGAMVSGLFLPEEGVANILEGIPA